MLTLAELDRLFRSEPWPNRIAYVLILALIALYLLCQLAMTIMWLAGTAQPNNP